MPTLDQIMTWAKENQLMLGLLMSAVIGSMPELLPTWRQAPQWAWTWVRDSAKTFLNFRRLPTVEPPAVPKPTTIEKTEDKPVPQQLNG